MIGHTNMDEYLFYIYRGKDSFLAFLKIVNEKIAVALIFLVALNFNLLVQNRHQTHDEP